MLPGSKNLPQNIISKIILARCLASHPSLLAIEEPFDFLEKDDRERIAHLLTDGPRNCTLVTVTDNALMAAKCDKVIILQNGRIVEDGSFEQIKDSKHFENVFKVG